MIERQVVITPDMEGMRLDRAATIFFSDISRSAVQRLCEKGYVLLNGRLARKNELVQTGSTLLIHFPQLQPMMAIQENISLEIVYEDNDLLVINKPKGMVVHPGAGNPTGTLVNALLYHCGESLSGIGGVLRPGIVHRIDKDTSGLLVVAKHDFAHQVLSKQIKEHSFKRRYVAIIHGHPKKNTFTINAPIGRSHVDRKKMQVTNKNARYAITHVNVLERLPKFSYICCQLETGRTHQIRVHMAYVGHPIAGDQVYGPKRSCINTYGQCLHAQVIGFQHPTTDQWLEFSSPLPIYFHKLLTELRGCETD